MCDAFTVSAISAATGVLGTGLSAYSMIQQGAQQKEQYEYKQRVKENEAQLARNAATDKENIHREKVNQLLSRQKVQLGASGVGLDTGSALNIQQDTVTQGEADALRIRDYGDQQYVAGMDSASFAGMQGNQAFTQGFVNAGGSLLSGASNVLDSGIADKWFTPNSVGKIE